MTTHAPPEGRIVFDAMCAQLEEWETLPSVKSTSPEMADEVDANVDDQTAPLDGLILAGLVSP
jgi:hypothetical protein